MTTPHRLRAESALAGYTRRHKRNIIPAELGNSAGTVDVPTRGGGIGDWVYCRLYGDASQLVMAYSGSSFPHVAGVQVAVEKVDRKAAQYYEVLGLATSVIYPGNPYAGKVGSHGDQHERRDFNTGGFDPVDVSLRMLADLRARAQDTPALTLYVDPGPYKGFDGSLKAWAGGNSPAFTLPAGGAYVLERRCDLLYISSADALTILQGVATTDGTEPAKPTCPLHAVPLAWVYLDSSMTVITDYYIADARFPYVMTGNTVAARKNSAGSTLRRARMNLIEGANVTITVADDSVNDEIDVTIAASAAGGNVTDTGAVGSEPGSPNDGDLYFPDNGFSLERYDGAAWVNWGPIFAFTKVVTGDFAWVNQGNATLTTTNGAAVLYLPSGEASAVHALTKAIPARPYTITLGFIVTAEANNSYPQLGLLWRESATGKIVTAQYAINQNQPTPNVGSNKWTNPTTFSASYTTVYPGGTACPMFWLRIYDDNTNRKSYYSCDGINFHEYHSVARADFFTTAPDEVGFFICTSGSSKEMWGTFLSWKQT